LDFFYYFLHRFPVFYGNPKPVVLFF